MPDGVGSRVSSRSVRDAAGGAANKGRARRPTVFRGKSETLVLHVHPPTRPGPHVLGTFNPGTERGGGAIVTRAGVAWTSTLGCHILGKTKDTNSVSRPRCSVQELYKGVHDWRNMLGKLALMQVGRSTPLSDYLRHKYKMGDLIRRPSASCSLNWTET